MSIARRLQGMVAAGLLLIAAILLPGCLEFMSIEQPSSVLPGESLTVLIAATAASTEGDTVQPYFGVCLPLGWTIPGDAVSYTGAAQGTIRYDPNLSLEQEDLSPAPQGYYWWVGAGDNVGTEGGVVFAEVSIQTDLQPGRYSLDYLLAAGDGGLPQAQRSANHITEVTNEFTPRELKAVVAGNSVVLTWLPPQKSEGLTGYRVYRDGQLIHTGPAEITEILDQDVAAGVFYYSASAVYGAADEQLTPYEVRALVFSGGTGEPNDPYQIGLADQLLYLADDPNLLDKAFLLVNDIDLDPHQWGLTALTQAVIPVFSGIFDGNDHTISHLTIAGRNNLGLFGRLESGAQVLDLGLIDVNIAGSGSYVGALGGYNGGSIGSSYSSGSVGGTGAVGGLVGFNNGSIVESYSSGAVNGTNAVGGLAGESSGTIIGTSGSGSVSGSNDVGGLVGANRGSIVTSYSSGAVSGTGNGVGGLVGYNGGRIATSYSSGLVSGTSEVGGLVGKNGENGRTTASFWDIETSSRTTSAGGIGRTTAELQKAATFMGWGLDSLWTIDEGKDYPRLAWEQRPGEIITSLFYSGGRGTTDDPYQIARAVDLIVLGVSPEDYDKHFILTADIDLDPNLPGRKVFDRAIIAPHMGTTNDWFRGTSFTGVFDGKGHTIRNLKVTGGEYLGLFGVLGSPALVSNLGLEGVEVSGSGNYVGGLVGENNGAITASYSSGSIRGSGHSVGGLVGRNYGGLAGLFYGGLATSYSAGSVNGAGDVGGLVGHNQGSIVSSYSSASVSGGDGVGGLVGFNMGKGSIGSSYSTGSVSGVCWVGGLVGSKFVYATITTSFWDIQTSGQATSAGGTGKTTLQMQTAKTFLDAGWDFVGETVNGTEDVWWIDEGKDYPRLRSEWQASQ